MSIELRYCIVYVLVDVFCLILGIVMAFNLRNDSGSEMQVNFFKGVILGDMVFCASDAVWIALLMDPFIEDPAFALPLANGVCQIALTFCAYCWLCFTLLDIDSSLIHKRNWNYVLAIPVVLALVIHIIGIMFNQGLRFEGDIISGFGVAYHINIAITALYLLAASFASFRFFLKTSHSEDRRRALIFIAFMIAPACAATLNIIILNTPIAALGITLAVVFIMMTLQESRISRDVLTDLNNRRRTEVFLKDCMQNASANQPIHVFIIDMNKFKRINDQYGHLEGDRALKLMASALRQTGEQLDAFVGRWGGDEFMLVISKQCELSPPDIAQLLKANLKEAVDAAQLGYNLNCSVGYAYTTSAHTSLTQLLEAADEMLYLDKRRELATT